MASLQNAAAFWQTSFPSEADPEGRPVQDLARCLRYRLSMKAFPPNRRGGWTPKLRDGLFAPLVEELLMWSQSRQSGKIGWILLWLLGVPIPILLILFFMRGCT